MHLHGTGRINERGHLEIGGCDTVELARRFGTPLYVMDEQLIRDQMRRFVTAFRQSGLPFQVAYASKAFCTMAMCRVVQEEGLHLDVVSDGELYTALKAGFPPESIHFHGSNKTPFELEMALDAGIGLFIVDNFTELSMLNQMAGKRGERPRILLRVTPGVEVSTHQHIQTGQEDSRFGFNLSSGQAMQAVNEALHSPPFGVGGLSLPYRVANFRNRRIRVGDREVGGFGEGGAGTSRLLSAHPQCGRRVWHPLRGGGSAHLAGGICGSDIRRGPAEF